MAVPTEGQFQQIYQEMNALPEILRDTLNPSSILRRQGPLYQLKLDSTFRKTPSISIERSPADTMRTRLKLNRYSIEKGQRSSRKIINYSTISYDHMNDPEFHGTKGKMDQVESIQVLLYERQKAADIVGLKVSSVRGVKEEYLSDLKEIEKSFMSDIKSFEQIFRGEMATLRQTISDLRRQTGQQLRCCKHQLKQYNDDLLLYCQQIKKIEAHRKTVQDSLHEPLN